MFDFVFAYGLWLDAVMFCFVGCMFWFCVLFVLAALGLFSELLLALHVLRFVVAGLFDGFCFAEWVLFWDGE